MRTADMLNKTFEYLTVIERAGSQNNHALWKCTCKCGNTVIATTGDLKQGKTKSCGCRKQEQRRASVINEVGHSYGRLTVLERAGSDKDGKALWKCQCECGNYTVVSGKALRKGTTLSCGCYNKDIISKRSLHDLSGMRFGMLTVISRAETVYKNNSQNTCWLCQCDCGNYTVVYATALTTEGHTRSCGCLKTSYREKLINDVLERIKINFKREYSFNDLLSPLGYHLRFDFAIFDNVNNLLCLIEHQGEQHYQEYANGFGDYQRLVTDKIKKEYCCEHNIPLFEIKYDDDILKSIKTILSQLNISYVNSVPSLSNKEG